MASDRMLTSGDIQFEPDAPKTKALTSSIAIMQSGDASFQGEIVANVEAEIGELVKNTKTWIPVQTVVDLYVKHYSLAKLKRAESAILRPLNLDRDSFKSEQRLLQASLVERVAEDLINYSVPDVSVIIAGVDNSGPRIFMVERGVATCHDAIGFAAIGIGARHAESQLMLARHSWVSSAPETFVVTHAAKRRSEIAPGVGSATDLYMVGPRPGTFDSIKPEVLQKLDAEYEKLRDSEDTLLKSAISTVDSYVASLAQIEPPAAEEQGEPKAASEGGDVSAGAEEKEPLEGDAKDTEIA